MLNSQIATRILTLFFTILFATAMSTLLWQSAVSAALPIPPENQEFRSHSSADSNEILTILNGQGLVSKNEWQIKTAASAITSGMLINEVDADTEDFDTEEFIELFDGGAGNTPLDGLVVVVFNGIYDLSYAAYDLDGYSSDAQGYFLLGNAAVPGVDLIISNGTIQNGADAIALYDGDAADFPNDTAVIENNLLDAIVYDTDDADDNGLLALLEPDEPQVNENGRSSAETHSNQRCPNGMGGQRRSGSYLQNQPTPGATNKCVFDAAPQIMATSPADEATTVPLSATITITFSEAVAVGTDWFEISCNLSGDHSAVVTGGDLIYDLVPDDGFSTGEACLVTVHAQEVHDLDDDDPPDQLAADYQWQFTTFAPPLASHMIINELDAETPGIDTLEFIELYDGGEGHTALHGLTVVLYTGGSDLSYKSFDLDGFFTNQEGYFVLGNTAVPGVDLVFANDTLQNGPDAVALFAGSAAGFPIGSQVITENLLDALVYDTGDDDDDELLHLLHQGQPQVNEAGRGFAEFYSNQRCPDGQGGQRNSAAYLQNLPTPGLANDCVLDLAPEVEVTFPLSGAVDIPLDAALLVTFNEEVQVGGQWFALSCADSGSHVTNVSAGPLTFILDPQENFAPRETCQATILGSLVTDMDGISQTMASDYSWAFTSGVQAFGACGNPAVPIHSIQGSGSGDSLEGAQGLIVEGIISADFRGEDALGGYFIQQTQVTSDNNPATSDALFILDDDLELHLKIGDLVRVQGDVVEIDGMTAITNVVNFAGCGPGLPVAPSEVALPIASMSQWETWEGMLVSFSQNLAVTGNAKLGSDGEVELALNGRLFQPTEVVLPGEAAVGIAGLNNHSRITLDDGSLIKYPLPLPPYLGLGSTLRVGDTISGLLGILTETAAGYRIQPTQPLSFTRANERPSAPPDPGGRLRLVTFDAGDYFNGDGRGGGFPGVRGAKNAAEFARQRAKIISALTAVQADIVVLTAMENDGFGADSALQDLVNGLNESAPAGVSYALVSLALPQLGQTETAVGLLYRQETVQPMGAAVTTHIRPFAALNSQPLVQTFAEAGSGETFVVAAAQFRPRDTCPITENANSDQGDGQGCYSLLRAQAAYELERWLASDPTGSGEDDIFILGNLNAYKREDPLLVLEQAGYSSLAQQLGSSGYTSVISGETGTLIHALATRSLAAQIQNIIQWHINADEPEALDYREINQPDLYNTDFYRSSAHDPLIIDLDPATINISFRSDPSVQVGQAIQFTNESSGPGIASYEWDFGDGSPTVTAVNAQHTYAAPSIYTVTLTAATTWGKTITFSRMVQVRPAQIFLPSISR